MVGIEHLQVIDIIAKEGSFRKASEKLNKARSAVSYSVKLVEEYYQIEIFTRDTYRPQLTNEGKIFVEQMRRLLGEANAFDVFATQMSGEIENEIRIGISSIFPLERITTLLSELKQSFPQTVIHLDIEVGSGERMLTDDIVDIGIYGVLEKSKSIDYNNILDIKLPVWISRSIVNSDQDVDLSLIPQVVVKSSYRTSPDFGFVDGVQKWFVSDNHTKLNLIKNGLAWGRVAEHEIDRLQSHDLVSVSDLDVVDLPIYVAKLKSRALGPVAKKIWNFFESD